MVKVTSRHDVTGVMGIGFGEPSLDGRKFQPAQVERTQVGKFVHQLNLGRQLVWDKAMLDWLVVWNMFYFFHILGIVFPFDSYFSEG